jgi:CII-binding regulator of phage lambda lysogenization HflD
VTTTIQAVCVPFKRDDGRDDSITICDTPGFGDTKGIEQDLSNGLGIIHALKGAASIKPVIVIDYSTMHANRWDPLKKTLSTIIAMIGRESIDFAPFAYIFTRCEGKHKNRISKKLEGFEKVILEDTNLKDKDILYALLTDMISKAKPGEAICIDPEETDDAPDTLKRLLSGSRLNSPAESFVNFCSKESMATLSVQVSILIHNLDISLQAANMDSAEAYLRKMIGMAESLSLPEVHQDVQKGIRKAKQYVTYLSSNIESLTAHLFSDFDKTLIALSPKLQLLSKSVSISNICEMDFNCCSFINGITEGLISKIRQAISDVDPTIPSSAESLQQSIIRFDSIVTLLQGLMDSETIENETSTMIEAIKHLIEPIFVALEVSLVSSDPTSTTLKEKIDEMNFVVAMNNFFGSSKLSTFNLIFSEWVSGLNNILDNINEKSQNCVTNLKDLEKSLDEELLGVKEWSYESLLKLNNSVEHKECRDFLQAVSSSESLFSAIDKDSTPDFKSMIRDFDDYITKYSQQSTYFLQCKSQTMFENVAGDMAGRVKEAEVIIESTDCVIEAMTTIEDIEPTIFKKAMQDLNDVKSRSEHFIEDSKRTPVRHRHSIRRGKPLAPTEEELIQTKNKQALLRWYKKCNELKVYWKKNGHCDVPQKDPKLGLVSRR